MSNSENDDSNSRNPKGNDSASDWQATLARLAGIENPSQERTLESAIHTLESRGRTAYRRVERISGRRRRVLATKRCAQQELPKQCPQKETPAATSKSPQGAQNQTQAQAHKTKTKTKTQKTKLQAKTKKRPRPQPMEDDLPSTPQNPRSKPLSLERSASRYRPQGVVSGEGAPYAGPASSKDKKAKPAKK